MERYNLPEGGIEVVINGEHGAPRNDMVSALPSPTTNFTERGTAPLLRKRKPLRYIATRSLMLIGAFALVGNIPVYSKINPIQVETVEHFALDTHINSVSSGSDEVAEQEAVAVAEEGVKLDLPVSVETYTGHEIATLPSATTGKWELRHIGRGETLEDILTPLKLATTIESLLIDPAIKKELSNLKADKKVLVQVNNRKIDQLIYAVGKRKAYIVSFQDGKYSGKWDNGGLFEEQHNRIAFTIHNPFHYDAGKAGLPVSISRQLVKIFKKDVNFRRIKPGDQVSTIFEDYYYQSERIFTGKVLASEFKHRGDIHQRIRFTLGNNKSIYLKPNDDLEIKQVAFNRRPLRGGRLSSGFGMRHHPVLRKRRMHAGTDFAAPRGTPIYATGDGRVRFVGRRGGYGKSIELRHDFGVSTRYGHMSRYKKGLTPGSIVKRGDVIGYVGSTGRSTGNHVHYEYRVDGKPQNPMKVKLPMKGLLSKKEMQDFQRLSKNMGYQLIKLRDTASIERNVRQQFGG